MPETVLDKLSVLIGADFGLLKRNLRAAMRVIKRFGQRAGRIAKSIARGFMRIGGVFAKLARKIGKYAKWIGIAILGVAAASVKMAMDAEESENLFVVSMGKMEKSARRWSEKTSEALGLNAFEMRKYLGTLNVMIKNMGLSEKASFDMSKGFTQLTYDMASFYNLKPEEAFLKLQAAISGEIEPLKRLGINIKDTAVKQWNLNKSLTAGNRELTEAEKIFIRYHLVLEQTELAQDDLERTANSLTNVFRVLWSQIQLLSVEIGNHLTPVVKDVAIAMRDWLKENRRNISESIGYALQIIKDFVAYMKSDFVKGLQLGMDLAIVVFEGFGESVREIFSFAGDAAATGFINEFGKTISRWLIKSTQSGGWIDWMWKHTPLGAGVQITKLRAAQGILERIAQEKEGPSLKDLLKTLDKINIKTKAALERLVAPIRGMRNRFNKPLDTPSIMEQFFASFAAEQEPLYGPRQSKATSRNVYQPLSIAEFKATMEEMGTITESISDRIKNNIRTWGEVAVDIAGEIQRSLGAAFADVLMNAKSFKDAMIGFLKQIGVAIIQNITMKMAGGIVDGITTFIGGLFKPTEMAEGGIITRPTIIKAGENFKPEAIIPLDKIEGLGGIVININSPWDGQSVMHAIESGAVRAVLRSYGANGPIRTMMRSG